jgi:hypothetical protein
MRQQRLAEAPRLVYRGTQQREQHGVRGATSWTDSLPVAMIWSAVPADPWASSRELNHAHFIDTSTIHAAHLNFQNPLALDYNQASVGDIMRALRYGEPDGIADDEVRKVFNYLHNRMMGKAAGGEFGYVVYDEDGGEIDPDDRELSFDMSDSLIRDMRDEFEYADEKFEVADRIAADAYVFFDSKTVQAVARRLGFDGFVYWDIFEGCEYAARDLFGKDVDCANIEGIEEATDLKDETVFTHRTYRPLSEESVVPAWDAPSLTLLPELPNWLR